MSVKLLRDRTGDETSRPEIMIIVRFNLMKNKRNKAGELYVPFRTEVLEFATNPNLSIEVTIREDRNDPLLCPVLDILALADADNAWKNFKSSKDLYAYRLPAWRDSLDVPFKDEICGTPFLRMVEPYSKIISSTLAWKCSSINVALKDLSLRAGMRYHVTPYDIRRASANILHSE